MQMALVEMIMRRKIWRCKLGGTAQYYSTGVDYEGSAIDLYIQPRAIHTLWRTHIKWKYLNGKCSVLIGLILRNGLLCWTRWHYNSSMVPGFLLASFCACQERESDFHWSIMLNYFQGHLLKLQVGCIEFGKKLIPHERKNGRAHGCTKDLR